jgi:hypothetical protein
VADDCVLVERATGKPPAKNDPFWQKGEALVGGPNDAGVSDFARAREDAIRRATRACEARLACEGKDCDNPKERICVLDVEVLKNRSGQVEERKVHVPPGGVFVERDIIQYYATWEVQARARCGCTPIPKPIRPGTGPSQQLKTTLSLLDDLFIPFFLRLLTLEEQGAGADQIELPAETPRRGSRSGAAPARD